MKTDTPEILLEQCEARNAEKLYHQWVMMKYWGIGIGVLLVASFVTVILGGFDLLMDVLLYVIIIVVIVILYPVIFKQRIIRSEKCQEYVRKTLQKRQEKLEHHNKTKKPT